MADRNGGRSFKSNFWTDRPEKLSGGQAAAGEVRCCPPPISRCPSLPRGRLPSLFPQSLCSDTIPLALNPAVQFNPCYVAGPLLRSWASSTRGPPEKSLFVGRLDVTYEPRIPADPAYVQAIGRAFYNFTYLEWVVVWTIVKLSRDGFGSVPQREPASKIAAALIKAIQNTSPPLPSPLRKRLVKFHGLYVSAIRTRNKLLHSHPYTAPGGLQQLGGGGLEWPIEAVDEAAKDYEDAAIEGISIFHGELARVRP